MVHATWWQRLPRKLLANLIGAVSVAAFGLAFVPIYVRLLGVENYGLIGLYATLQALLQVFDLGFSPTISRELARASVQPERAPETRDLVRTLEASYWVIGGLIGLGLLAVTPLIARYWLNAPTARLGEVQTALMGIGLLIAIQWPLTFYQGGLMGLQKQILANSLLVTMTALRHVGAVVALTFGAPTVLTFFGWQIVAALLHVTLTTLALWRSLPWHPRPPRFRWPRLAEVSTFAGGMSLIGLTALILTQLDKVLLSRLLTLETFGHYMLAATLSNGLALLVGPVFHLIFPRLSALTAQGATVADFYQLSAQVIVVLVLPTGLMLIAFAQPILTLWLGDAVIAQTTAPLARLLVTGSLLNSFMVAPYALQLANGWTGLGVRLNVLLIGLMLPALLALTTQYGSVGASAVWPLLNLVYLIIGLPATHQRLLPEARGRWLMESILLPAGGAGSVIVLALWLFPMNFQPPALLFYLIATWAAAQAAAFVAASQPRRWLIKTMSQLREAR